MKKSLTILSLAAFELAGCVSTQVVSACPPVIEYDAQTQKQTAAELRKLPKDSTLALMVIDYKKTRDALRLCN
mgnify:CR=1 FL=1